MSVYRIPLANYNLSYYRLPIFCGGHNFLIDFYWDDISQTHYDNIQKELSILGQSNSLVLVSSVKNIIPNTDFLTYIEDLNAIKLAYETYRGIWEPILLHTPEAVDWTEFIQSTQAQKSSFFNQYISFNHLSKLQEFLVYFDMLLNAAASSDVALCLSLLQNTPASLFVYIMGHLAYVQEARIQLAELKELMYWSLTIHHGEEAFTTALEIGSVHFPFNRDFDIMFSCEYSNIGKNDLHAVTLFIGVNDNVVA